MNSIIDNQREILLSVEGTNIWSGQQPQQYNSQAVAWGGLSHQLFAVGKRYQWVAWAYVVGIIVPVPFWIVHRFAPKLRLDYLYTPVIWCALPSHETHAQVLTNFLSLQLLHRLALRWHQFLHLVLLLDRLVLPMVPAHAVSQVVREV